MCSESFMLIHQIDYSCEETQVLVVLKERSRFANIIRSHVYPVIYIQWKKGSLLRVYNGTKRKTHHDAV